MPTTATSEWVELPQCGTYDSALKGRIVFRGSIGGVSTYNVNFLHKVYDYVSSRANVRFGRYETFDLSNSNAMPPGSLVDIMCNSMFLSPMKVRFGADHFSLVGLFNLQPHIPNTLLTVLGVTNITIRGPVHVASSGKGTFVFYSQGIGASNMIRVRVTQAGRRPSILVEMPS